MTRSTQPGRRSSVLLLVGYLAAVAVVSVVGGLAGSAGQGPDGWYAAADKPFFTPPGWVFGPVWTVLYVAMAVAAWRLAVRRGPLSPVLRLWWLQLVLNLAWTPLFFTAQWLWAALVDIVLLDLVLALLVWRARRVDPPAAWLLAPYLAWVLFATALTAGVVALN